MIPSFDDPTTDSLVSASSSRAFLRMVDSISGETAANPTQPDVDLGSADAEPDSSLISDCQIEAPAPHKAMLLLVSALSGGLSIKGVMRGAMRPSTSVCHVRGAA